MKTRIGFVSNSSSSSFIIFNKHLLSEEQLNAIHNHIQFVKENEINDRFYCDEDDAWNIAEMDHVIKGSTFMDNFDMRELFDILDIDNNNYKFYD